MKVAFRVDASMKIGTGHVTRCLSLAECLRSKGSNVYFICRELSGHLIGAIANKEFAVHPLPSPPSEVKKLSDINETVHAPWLEVPWQQDLAESLNAMKIISPEAVADWLIVDHYALDYRWENGMREAARKIMAIDDLADRKHDCDVLLDQNYFQNPDGRYGGLVPDDCEMILGTKYALLRPEFCEARKFCRMRGNGIARILIYFGGNDPDNLTGIALAALSSPEFKYLLVDVVIGPNNLHHEMLERLVSQRKGTRLHIQPDGFTELMLRADLCIGAGGATTWERLCLGLPSLVITVAKNQEPFIQELSKLKYIRWIGKQENITIDDIVYSLFEIIYNPNDESLVGLNDLVDGKGTKRVLRSILNNQTTRRKR